MSHGDYMEKVPAGFSLAAHSAACPNVAIADEKRGFYGVQFHPEVNHTDHGVDMIRNFLYNVCGAKGTWTMEDYKKTAVAQIREKVGDGKVLLALSGGVDSSVCAALLAEAVGEQLTCVFVDHGLMRKDEGDEVEAAFSQWAMHFVRVNAETRFLLKLAGVTEPERKRKIIGEEFIRVFEAEAQKDRRRGFPGPGHHLPGRDRVRAGGRGGHQVPPQRGGPAGLRGLPGDHRAPAPALQGRGASAGPGAGPAGVSGDPPALPGPGLAIRIIGDITKEKADTLREADFIFRDELTRAGEAGKISQYFAVLTNTRSVGVMGDGRTYDYTLALRAVTTDDFMTADWARIPYEVLDRVSTRIVNEVPGINRIVYDITSKPPATVEWE